MIVRIIEVLLGGMFLVSGALKAWDPASFYRSIEDFQVMPAVLALWMAYYLPYLEILVGLGLVLAIKPRECAVVVSGLLAVFILALISAWARGLNIECGCFGSANSVGGLWEPLLRDGVLAVAAAYVIKRRFQADSIQGIPAECSERE